MYIYRNRKELGPEAIQYFLSMSQVRRLIIEGKSNKAVVNHFTVINDNLTEFQVITSFPLSTDQLRIETPSSISTDTGLSAAC